MFNKFKNKKENKGFILLIGILVAFIIFSIGIGMAIIVFKELVLSFTARESTAVFFTSDAHVECAKYWDNARDDNRFQSAFHPDNPTVPEPDQDVECDGVVVPSAQIEGEGTHARSFWIDNTDPANSTNYCANIEIRTCDHGVGECEAEDDPTLSTKRLTSWAFNTCDVDFGRRVDRAIRSKYENTL